MEKDLPMPSLVPYLKSDKFSENDGEQKVHLVPAFYPGKSSGGNRAPFLIISASDPICKILEAKFVTNGGYLIKKVFLLIQKDQYDLRSEDIWPITNQDIEQCWQRAYEAYKGRESQNQAVMVFKEQIGKNGGLLPFSPLFFCKKTACFFHPSCPVCGIPLQQCQDDLLLTKNGLDAYSSSLSRYLFCKACAKEVSDPVFYAKSINQGDPVSLKGMGDIVTGYYRLVKAYKASGIPCQKCEHFDECFENDDLAKERIEPFSFYPFYMMVFDAPTINSLEFLSLLSGAKRKEISDFLFQKHETGRKHCVDSLPEIKEPLLFEKTDRLFYEILYLKLAFLGEFANNLLGRIHHFKYPDLSLSLDKIWVKLNHENSMLPAFWNFDLVTIDIGGDIGDSAYLPKMPPFFGLYHLGIIWFYSLLVNTRQGTFQLQRKLSKIVQQWLDGDSEHLNDFLEDDKNPEFAPENIFSNPDKMSAFMPGTKSLEDKFSGGFKLLWDRALGLGWYLLEASLVKDAGWSMDNFLKELDQLKQEVKVCLFQEGSTILPESVPEEFPDDPAISTLMFHIAEKWQHRLVEEIMPKEPVEKADLEESKYFRSEDLDEDISETVMISPDEKAFENYIKSEEVSKHVETETEEDDEEDIPETIMMSGNQVQVPSGNQGLTETDDEFLAETVILDTGKLGLRDDRSSRIFADADKDQAESKSEDSKINESSETEDFDEDELLKTVMIDPDTLKGKKR